MGAVAALQSGANTPPRASSNELEQVTGLLPSKVSNLGHILLRLRTQSCHVERGAGDRGVFGGSVTQRSSTSFKQ